MGQHKEEPDIATYELQNPPPTYEIPTSSLSRFQEYMNDHWVYEILASIISLGTLAAIFGVLHKYNHTEVDAWSESISLGSLIQLLATISQTAMVVPLASGISQLKWVWYKKSQKLADLDMFDQGSRGPLGSFLLLFSRPFKFLGALGAIITILTLAFNTLIQNAISTDSGQIDLWDDNAVALFPQGNNYSLSLLYSTGKKLGDQGPPLDMVADINYGMFYTSMLSDTQIQQSVANCSTGNCTWPHVQTLGVCSKCADISSSIGHDEGYYTLYGTTLVMDEEIGLVTSLGYTKYPDPSALPDVGPLIVHLTVMARSTTSQPPTGIDCALYWCVIDYGYVEMVNYVDEEYDITNWTDTSAAAKTTYLQEDDITLTPPTCYDEFGTVSDTIECTKTVDSYAQAALQNFFTGPQTGFTGMATKNTTTGGWDISSEFIQLLFSATGLSDDFLSYVRLYMKNIGLLMTSNIRQHPYGTGIANSQGQASSWTTLFHIRWGFLGLPMVLAVASILFLVTTIIKSRGQEKWKSSLLPLLFHPLGERPEVAPHKLSHINAMAGTKAVKLEKSDYGSQFV